MRHFRGSEKILALLISAWLAVPAACAADTTATGQIKKSSTGICHAPGTAYYDQTNDFTPYKTMQDCLDSGGRYPKGQEPSAGPPVKKSVNGICHDSSSPSYSQTKNFLPFDTMEECIRSGGRRPKS